jgi:addiction module HigA family antidote
MDFKSIPANGVKLRAVHPGWLLAEELEFRGLTANALAVKIGVPRNRMTAIIKRQRAVTIDTALRIERCLGIAAYLLIRMQSDYDLQIAEKEMAPIIDRIVPEPPMPHAA